MEQDFYVGRLRSHGLQVLIPDEPDRTVVHEVIYGELVRGSLRQTQSASTCGSSTVCVTAEPTG